MFNNRKAQGLSVHTIIVAIIGLIILVAVILMLSGKLVDFDKGITGATSCESKCSVAGFVKGSTTDTCGDGEQRIADDCCCKQA